METRDKLLILIVIAWIAAAVYFKATTDKMFLRLDEMEQLQVKHVDEVNQEFRSDLKTLNLQFIGRGKHLRQAQKDIVSNNKFIGLYHMLGRLDESFLRNNKMMPGPIYTGDNLESEWNIKDFETKRNMDGFGSTGVKSIKN